MYVDPSALVKVYVHEPESDEVEHIIAGEAERTTARVTLVEIRRNLARLLRANALARARVEFDRDWDEFEIVEIDEELCDRAAEVAELTGVKTLDALHLAAARRADARLLTYDLRQARAARSLGLEVVGAA